MLGYQFSSGGRRYFSHVTWLILLAVICLPACTVHTPMNKVEAPVELPAAYSGQGEGEGVDRWWETINDPVLNRLVEETISQNLDLRSAWFRIDQAQALALQAGSARLPEITGTAGMARNRAAFYAGEEIGQRNFVSNSFPLSIAASYEVDLWKRVQSSRQAAEMDILASREDMETMAMTLAAQTADAWSAAVEQTAQLKLLHEQADIGRTYLRLVELRFSQGLASAVDVYQQRQQLAATESQFPQSRGGLELLHHQLAVLRGRAPQEDVDGIRPSLPELPDLPDLGLPADLIQRRPDIRQRYFRILAADRRLGVAIADQYPSLRLSASTGFQGRRVQDIFSNWVYNLAANLTAPLFDGGRRKAEVDRNRAYLSELISSYGQALLQAVKEVEDALSQETHQREYLSSLENQILIAKDTLVRARARYANGLSDYLPVLTALQSLQQLERSFLTARYQLISHRIRLYRALGGSWTSDLTRDPQKSEQITTENTDESPETDR